jgi:hypothetical protein
MGGESGVHTSFVKFNDSDLLIARAGFTYGTDFPECCTDSNNRRGTGGKDARYTLGYG